MSKKNILAISICSAVFLALLAVATFFDLQINLAIGNGNSIFGQFFSYLGDSFAWIAIPISAVILYQAVKKTNKYYKLLKILFLILTFVGFYLVTNYLFGKFVTEIKCEIIYVILFAALGTFFAILGTNKVDKDLMEKLVIFAVFTILCVAVSQGVITLMKELWARQRFRNLEGGNILGGDTSGFTPWYKPTLGRHDETLFVSDAFGAEDEDAYKSFPSGHTASAAITFVIIMLPELFEKLKKHKVWFYVVPSVITAVVAISRMVNRAHYLSDVLFGGAVTIALVFLIKYLTYKVYEKIRLKRSKDTQTNEVENIAVEENA